MPWKCRLVTREERLAIWERDHRYPVGLMFYAWETVKPPEDNYYKAFILSPEYLRDHYQKRPPLIVVLPGGHWWNMDTRAASSWNGWTVVGEPPNVTVTPSINVVGVYHGWLRDGVLSDDVEGRVFPDGGGRDGA